MKGTERFEQEWLDSVAMEGHGVDGQQRQRSVFTVQVISIGRPRR